MRLQDIKKRLKGLEKKVDKADKIICTAINDLEFLLSQNKDKKELQSIIDNLAKLINSGKNKQGL